MLAVLLSTGAVFGLLVLSEYWWRHSKIHNELGRKFVHISVGTFVAFWPYIMSWEAIKLLSVAFLVVITLSKVFNVFQAIHSVQRPTWGEIFFALVVGGLAFVTENKAIYTAALLQMSLADGLAAIMGTEYGKNQVYHIFGHKKSLVGTITFFIISAAILAGYSSWHHALSVPFILLTALLATLVENLAVAGLDNLVVPLLVALLLRLVAP